MTFQGLGILEYFIVFVRTGTCLMILPGFSSMQLAMQIRLFIAIALSISIYFLVSDSISIDENIDTGTLTNLIASEFFIAAILAFPIRFFFLALSFLGEIIMQTIGLNAIPGTPIGDTQASTVLSSLFNVTAIVLFFASGLHMNFIVALAHSFTVLPPGESLAASALIETVSTHLNDFFNIAIRLSAPILIYAVIMNLIAGLVNKLSPQIPVYFVSTPFLICGGLIIMTWIADDILLLFNLELDRLINALF